MQSASVADGVGVDPVFVFRRPELNEDVSGNRCGHHPDYPRLIPVSPIKEGGDGERGQPKILVAMIKRVEEYYAKPHVLPSLNGSNGSNRQQRSERREACVLLLSILLKYLDLASMRVEVPNADGFLSLKIETLAVKSGLSLSRAERALADLISAGIMRSYQKCRKDGFGLYKALASTKIMNVSLFKALGKAVALEYERKRASKRLKQRLEEESREAEVDVSNNEFFSKKNTKTSQGRQELHRASIVNKIQRKKTGIQINKIDKAKPPDPPEPYEIPIEESVAYKKMLVDLHGWYPDWDRHQIKEEALRRLKGA